MSNVTVKFQKQAGMGLISLMAYLILASLLAIYGASHWLTRVNDAAAESTGQYLLTVRGAVLDVLARHVDTLRLVDITGAPAGVYEPAPAWATFAGASTRITVPDLKDAGFLRADFPALPPLGRSVNIDLIRSGTCPGASCDVQAFITTCWPVSADRITGAIDPAVCPAAPAGATYDPSLVGNVILAAEGFGGSNTLNPTRVTGSLFDVAASDLSIPLGSRGHVTVLASLQATMFNQFVRQADTRHIYINNALSVSGPISTDTGLNLKTAVVVGEACEPEGMYAMTARNTLATCAGAVWFELTSHVVMGTQANLKHGDSITMPVCTGPNMEPFTRIAMQVTDVTMTGTAVNVRGNLSGTMSGSGSVNAAGSVSVSGSFSGTMQSSPASTIRVNQGVDLVGSVVSIENAGPSARAMAVYGCRYL